MFAVGVVILNATKTIGFNESGSIKSTTTFYMFVIFEYKKVRK